MKLSTELLRSALRTLRKPSPSRRRNRRLPDHHASISAEILEDRTLLSGGSLFPGQQFDAGYAPQSVATADFNGDGVTDVIAAGAQPFAAEGVSLLLGNGDGTFQPEQSLGFGAYDVATADFDGDGAMDLAFAGVSQVSVLLGNGDGTFQPAQNFSKATGVGHLTTGDFNGDGVIDLASANGRYFSQGGRTVSVLMGNGDGTFQSPLNFSTGTPEPRFVTAGDFNGDGYTDLAMANRQLTFSNNVVTVMLGNGDGTLQSPQYFNIGQYASVTSVTTADVDGDGVLDLATANAGYNGVSILKGNGDGTFQSPQNFAAGSVPQSMTTGDFDGDGVIDLATGTGRATVSVLLGNGDGTFQSAQSFAAGANVYNSLTTGDFDGDGLIDIAAANSETQGKVTVLLGNGDGTFQSADNYPASAASEPSVATGDFNGDGVTDLVRANANNSHSISIMLGNGDGTFQAAQNYSGGLYYPRSITTGDFNGDGVLDLAMVNANSRVAVMQGNGDGTFQSAQTFATGTGTWFVTTDDFNGDGVIDLITANRSSASVSVLLGNGDGTFQTAQNFAAGSGPREVTIGDFNGDGWIDVATVNEYSRNVSVLLGNGDGTFQPPQHFAAGTGGTNTVFSLTTADFNGDGHLDLATASYPSSVSVLLGDGNGTFQTPQNFATGQYSYSVTTGDFDGDGVTDLAVANLSGANVSVLLGNGDGTFQPALHFAVGYSPYSVTTGDFNGDGDTDLVFGLASGVAVLLNTSNEPPEIVDFTITGSEDSSLALAAADFLANFSDPDGDVLVEVRIDSLPANGTLELGGALVTAGQVIAAAELDSLAFVPDLNFNGQTSFEYSASDGTEFSVTSASVTLDILAVNDAPTVASPIVVTEHEDAGAFSVNLLAGASDVDGDTLGVANVVLTGGDDAGVTVNGNSLDVDPSAYNHLAAGETEVISYTYDVVDGNGGSVAQTATITIEGRNDAPVGADFTRTGTEDSPVALSAADFIAQFSDPDTSDTLAEIRIDSLPANGVLELNGVALTAGHVIDVADLDDLVFVPDLNFNGLTSFTYSAGDGTAFSVMPATVTLDILSATEQVDLLAMKIDDLLAAGIINEGQAEALKYELKDNNGDIGKTGAFLNMVEGYIDGGILTEQEAEDLILCGELLLHSLVTT